MGIFTSVLRGVADGGFSILGTSDHDRSMLTHKDHPRRGLTLPLRGSAEVRSAQSLSSFHLPLGRCHWGSWAASALSPPAARQSERRHASLSYMPAALLGPPKPGTAADGTRCDPPLSRPDLAIRRPRQSFIYVLLAFWCPSLGPHCEPATFPGKGKDWSIWRENRGLTLIRPRIP